MCHYLFLLLYTDRICVLAKIIVVVRIEVAVTRRTLPLRKVFAHIEFANKFNNVNFELILN